MAVSIPVSLARTRPAARRLSRYLSAPHIILSFLFVLLMLYLILVPLGRMILTSLTWPV